MGLKCILCDEKYVAGTQISFHKFPKEERKRSKWISMCNLNVTDVYKTSVICSKHFIKDCFEYKKEDFVRRQQKLRVDAVPSIFCDSKIVKRKCQTTTENVESLSEKSITSHTRFKLIKLCQDLILDHNYCLPQSIDDSTSNGNRYSFSCVVPTLNLGYISPTSETKSDICFSDSSKQNDDVITSIVETNDIAEVYLPCCTKEDDDHDVLTKTKSISELKSLRPLKENDNPLAPISETKNVSEAYHTSSSTLGNDDLCELYLSCPEEGNDKTSSGSKTNSTLFISSSEKNVRYVGELTENHFNTPTKRKKNLLFVKMSHKKLQRKLKLLNEKCRRLTKRVDSLKGIIKFLNENQNLTKKTPHKIKM